MYVRANTICNYTICAKDIGYNLYTHMYLICTCTYTGLLISQTRGYSKLCDSPLSRLSKYDNNHWNAKYEDEEK